MENLLVPCNATLSITASRVLVLAPHPDDEVFGCGGAILSHVKAGVPLRVIVMTDGAYSPGVGEDRQDYVAMRQAECRAAARLLGYEDIVFRDHADRSLAYGERLVAEILTDLATTGADLMYAPSVMEMHPDHRALGMAAVEAVRRHGRGVRLALYEIGMPLRPNLLLDISAFAAAKQAAMECFVSQNARQRYDLDIAALNRYRTYTLPPAVTAAEAYILTSAEALAKDPFKLYQSEHERQKELGLTLDSRDVPLVSVIVRSMDRPTLDEALDSIALQTYANIEVVVVNAKGTGHREMGAWCGRYPMRLVGSDACLQRSRAANVGLDAAQGEYLIFLDDDDVFSPHHIAALKTAIDQSGAVVAAYSAVLVTDESDVVLRRFEDDFDPIQLRICNYIPIHAILFRREIISKGVRFDETLNLCEDWDFWLQVAEYGSFEFIPVIGATYRVYSAAGSGIWLDPSISRESMLAIYRKWLPRWSDEVLLSIFEYARYKRLFTDLQKSIVGRATQLAERDAQLAERDAQLAERDAQLAERDAQLAALLSSTSWRMTHPLRIVANQVKRVRHVAELFMPAIVLGGGIKNTLRKAIKIYQKEGLQGIKRGFRLVATSRIPCDAKDIDPAYQQWVSHPAEKLLVPRVLIIAEMSIPQCKKYRVQQKQEMFGFLGVDCTTLNWHDVQSCLDALQTHSLVIFYRVPAYPNVVSIINEAKRLRLPTLWEVDDFIFDREVLSKSKTIAAIDKNTFVQLLEGADLYRKAMLMCDRGIASTTSLADAMKKAGLSEVHVVENALDRQTLEVAEQVCRTQAIHQNDIVRIVYGSGTNTHNINFLEAATAIIRVLGTFSNVRFRIIGILDLPETFSRYEDQVERLPACTYEEYLSNLAECDISIAPLENYIFNDSKSNIKYLEASIVKVPSVCSPRAAFAQVIIHGENGFLCETVDEWEAALKLLVTDAAKRAEVSEAAYSSVLRHYAPESVAQKQVMPLLKCYDRTPGTLRVLSVSCFYYPRSFGGSTIVAEQVNKWINSLNGFEIHVFTALPSSVLPPYTTKRYEDNGINIYGVGLPDHLDQKTQFENREIVDAFANVLAVVQPDIVHFHSIQGIGVSVVDLCAQKGIKYVITLHDAWWLCGRQFMINKQGKFCDQHIIDLNVCGSCVKNNTLNVYRNKRLTAALRNASALLAPSRFFADFFVANGYDNVRVNKNGIRKPGRSQRFRRKGELRFGYVGGNTEIKGFHLIKKVFSDLADCNVRLVLVDNTLNLGLTSYHKQDLPGIPNVEILPAYTQRNIDDFFASIDVLLFPTQWKESFGLTVREATARNVWVIATDAGGVTEDIRHGENGLIVPLEDRGPALKQAVLDTLEYFKRFAVGDEIRLKAVQITFFEDQAAELGRVYTDVLAMRAGTTGVDAT